MIKFDWEAILEEVVTPATRQSDPLVWESLKLMIDRIREQNRTPQERAIHKIQEVARD